MIRIEIKAGTANKRSGTSVKSGKPWEIVEQEAWAFLFDQSGNPAPYPSKIVIQLENGQPPYPAGNYTLADQCFYVGDFGRLTVGRVKLVPVTVKQAAAA